MRTACFVLLIAALCVQVVLTRAVSLDDRVKLMVLGRDDDEIDSVWSDEPSGPARVLDGKFDDLALMSVVPVDELNAKVDVFLEEEQEVGKYQCKPGFKCPIEGAECCKGGEHCCLYGCNNELTPITCKPNDWSDSLRAAKSKLKEEAAKKEAQFLLKQKQEMKQKKLRKQMEQLNQNEAAEKQIATAQEKTTKKRRSKKEKVRKRAQGREAAKKSREEESQKREESQKQSQRRLPLKGRMEPYDRGYRHPMFTRLGELCMVSGLMIGPNQRTRIAKLPEMCRPEERLVFDLHISKAATSRFDVFPNGDIKYVAGAYNSGGNMGHWIPVDGISFTAAGSFEELRVPLNDPWVDYGRAGYQGARYHKNTKSGLCIFSGLIRTKDWRASSMTNPIFTMGPECRPDGKLTFSLNHQDVSFRVDILSTGEANLISGTRKRPWLSLSGLIFSAGRSKDTRALALEETWKFCDPIKRQPSYVKTGNLCVLSGCAQLVGGWASLIAVIDAECRPAQRLIFGVNALDKSQRIDVLKNGNLMWVDGKKLTWVSLDGIRYVVP